LLDAIGKELGLENWKQVEKLLEKGRNSSIEEAQIEEFRQQVKTLLVQGKLLVLMDGLDEVPTSELRRNIQDQLRENAEQYANNRWILTCRTQIIESESILIGFSSVEVADFSPEQVQQFVQNWFQASGHSDIEALQQWQRFNHAVDQNPAVKELTVTPVLLSLMCLVLHDEGEMPSQTTELYKRGIRLLLEKWNDAKAIASWEMGSDAYRQLSVEQKEALLIEIAARKFENPKNFVLFEQKEIVAHIDEFLRRTDFGRRIKRFFHPNDARESLTVLKAIEAQHGLLIERADELWSFSHLTFQEYFTVQWLIQLPPAQLAETIANWQWQQAVKQLVSSQQPADRLLRLIKQSVDQSISNESKLNQFLTWVLHKAGSIRTNDKPAALRAFYFALTLVLDFDLDLDRALALAFDLNRDLELAFDLDRDLALDRDLVLDLDLVLARTFARARTLDYNCDLNLTRALARDFDLVLILARSLDYELTIKLKQLGTRLPSLENWQHFQQWWQTEGQQWRKQLQQVITEYRNIGHDWQFNQQQKQQLQRYHDVNRFLAKLIKIEGAVSQDVRAEIEDSLLLPWDELQRRQPDVYGQPQSASPSPVRIFIAYSHEDEDLREELDRHLANLNRQGKIKAWHRGAIEAGAEWDGAIKQQLETAQIILLLISAHFIASNDCYDLLQQALQRHSAGTARVIPIILKPTDLKNSPFSHLSPLPTDGVPITRWSNRDEAFLNVVEGVRGVIGSLVQKK